MFDKLIDLIVEFIDSFRFWTVVEPYERAVVVTLGRRVRVLEPGPHWIYPFKIDSVYVDNVVPKTTNLNTQLLTTIDGHSIVIGLVVRWQIADIRKLTLEVENADHAFADVCYGLVGECVESMTWEEVRSPEFISKVRRDMRRNGKEWGIDVQNVRVTDRAKAKALRLIGDDSALASRKMIGD